MNSHKLLASYFSYVQTPAPRPDFAVILQTRATRTPIALPARQHGTMKRSRHGSSSEDSDDEGHSWSLHSKSAFRGNWPRPEGRKPSEVFRTDLITAMKLPDSVQLGQEEYCVLADPWRQEWEKGVQVPVSPQSIPRPLVRTLAERGKVVTFTRPKKLIRMPGSEAPVLGYVDICTLADSMCRYNLCEADVAWLEFVNEEFRQMGMKELDEITMERVLEEFERRCYDNMTHAMETEEGLGIEYDEDVVCDVCQSPHAEDGNEMVFCDKCNICVHQACYGILKVPEGSWLCRICALGILPKCLLCPKKGGAMKPTRSATKWVHVSCALWIPEVSIGSPEKMEPIMNVSRIPCNRWALICCLCKEKTGACIQCSAKNCRTAFHVTCALDRHLEMNTILTEEDEVKFKSFCPEHSRRSEGKGEENRDGGGASGAASQDESPPHTADPTPPAVPASDLQEAPEISQRKQKLQQLNDEFYTLVSAAEVSRDLQLSEETVDFLFQYWKLKRRANFNRPLLTPRKDEEDDLAKRERDVLLRRLKLFTHLRQDLERVRNLTYMVTRREKIKRSMCRVHQQLFHHHVRLLEGRHSPGVSSSVRLEDILFFGHPSSPKSKRKHCPGGGASQQQEWRRAGDPNDQQKAPRNASAAELVPPASHRPEGPRKMLTGPKCVNHQEVGSRTEAGSKMGAGPRIEVRQKIEGGFKLEAGPKMRVGLRVEAGPRIDAMIKSGAERRIEAGPKKEARLRIEVGPKKEAGLRIEAGPKEEAGPKKEAGLRIETGPKKEAGIRIEAVPKEEAGPKKEARLRIEAGPKKEAGLRIEAGPKKEAGLRIEAGPKKEAGLRIEAVPKEEVGLRIEAGPKKGEGSECLRRRGSAKGEERRDGLRERAPPKTRPRPVSVSESSADKPVEKRIVPAAGPHLSPKAGAQLCLGDGAPNLRVTLERLPKCNGSLVGLGGGSGQNVSAAPPPAQPPQPSRPAPSAHAKNWGSFRIPKKSERLLRAHLPAPSETPPSAPPYSPGHAHHTRTHRTESHGQGSAPQADCAERDVKGRRCPAHSSHSPSHSSRGPAHITRRYGADFLRPGILAS
ncbi:hypothetical protein GJAV_G00067710 [Gymnothorax javanicus]|nr:hypothetical protein GJAV_G00067710 [Gymnothorax javanicus]